jgi:hypothetical protein
MGSWFSSAIDLEKDFDEALIGVEIDKKKLTEKNFVDNIFAAIWDNPKYPKIKNKSHFDLVIEELQNITYKLSEKMEKTPEDKEKLILFIVESSAKIENIIDHLKKNKFKAANAPLNARKLNSSSRDLSTKKNLVAPDIASSNQILANNKAPAISLHNAESTKVNNNANNSKTNPESTKVNNPTVAANTPLNSPTNTKKTAANETAIAPLTNQNASKLTSPNSGSPTNKKKTAANETAIARTNQNASKLTSPNSGSPTNTKKAAANETTISPASSDLTQTTVQNTSSTKAANNEMYSSILKKLEGLKENMEKKVNEEFQTRIAIAKPGSIVTIYQIGGISFTRLIKLFLIIQKLRNNNNNTKKLELDLKNLLKFKVIDKKSKNKPEELLEKYKTEINSKPIDVLKREFNEECKTLFQYYTEIDESEIPKLEVKNNRSANQTASQIPNKTANQIANIIKKVLNLSENTVNNKDIDSQKFLDLIKLLLLLQKIIKDESLQLYLNRLIIRCGDTCGLTELKYVNMGKRGAKQTIVVSKEALEKFNSNSKNKSNSQLKIEINEMLKKFYKKYRESTPENEIPQINSPNNNARSNANTIVGSSNQSNLNNELSKL